MSDAAGRPVDGRSRSSGTNGKRGGCPEGKGHADRRTTTPEDIIENAVERVLTTGKLVARSAALKPPSADDLRTVQRVIGITADELNQRLSEKMGQISEKILARVEEKLEADAVKANELFFGLAVIEDKRARLDGRSTLNAATVNVQVNNFDSSAATRTEVLQRIGLQMRDSVNV
jgi:hypothetical protein